MNCAAGVNFTTRVLWAIDDVLAIVAVKACGASARDRVVAIAAHATVLTLWPVGIKNDLCVTFVAVHLAISPRKPLVTAAAVSVEVVVARASTVARHNAVCSALVNVSADVS